MELSNSIQIPQIGLGVYKMEAGDEMNNAIGAAWNAGYRLFDTAQMYRNEAALGDALKLNQIPRDEIFLISKVDNSNQWYQPTLDSLQESLKKLQTSYLDSFLIHWPGQKKNACFPPGRRWNTPSNRDLSKASASATSKSVSSNFCWTTAKLHR